MVEVPTDAGPVPIRVHGAAPLGEQDAKALGQLVQAATARAEADNPHGAVIQELMLASTWGLAELRKAGRGDLADRLSAAVRAARDLIPGPVTS